MTAAGRAGVLAVLQVPDNAADAAPCEPLRFFITVSPTGKDVGTNENPSINRPSGFFK
jgi:hypothetical protein